ncbi:TRM32 protein [Nymphaea thermarum]|nr:TRM32 protein [Nymphaea thermarum]
MLLEAKQAKGDKASKKKAGGREADIADGKVPVNENYKERSSSVHSYSGRLIKILMADEISKEPERGSSATSTSIPATFTDSLSDTDIGDIASLGEPAAESSASSLHLPQDVETHAVYEKNSLPEHGGWNNPSDESHWIMNSGGHSSYDQLDELGKQLLEKHALLQEKMDEAKEAILNHNYVDAKDLARDMLLHQSKDFVDALEILNTDRELFLELLQNPNPLAERESPDKQPFHEENDIICSSSLTNADSSTKKHVKDPKHKMKGKKWFTKLRKDHQDKDSPLDLQPTNLLKDVKHQKKKQDKDRKLDLQNTNSLKDADRMDKSSDPPKRTTVMKPASGTPRSNKDLDPSLSSTNKFSRAESEKAGNRFRDLKHRLKKAIKDGRKEQLHISMDGILHKVPYGTKDNMKEKVDQHKETTACGVNREQARSNADSCPSPSSSIKDDLNNRELNSSVTKSNIRDHPTTFTVLNENIESTASGRDQFSEEPASLQEIPSDGDHRKESHNGEPKNTENMVMKVNGEPELDIVHDDNEESAGSPPMHFPENSDHRKESHNGEPKNTENIVMKVYGEPELDIVHDDNEENAGSPPLHFPENSDIQHQELGTGTAKITETSPDSITDCHFEEGLVPMQMHEFQRKDSIVPQEDQCNGAVPHDAVAIPGVHANQVSADNGNSHDPYTHGDEEDKADFTYVMDVLKASGLRGDESPTQWHSREQPMDPLLFNEVGTLPTSDIAGVNMVTACNHQLLFDCINEALLEIYERSFKKYPWFMSLTSRTRTMPIGKYILDEVWSEISWHLESQSQLYPSVEYLVTRDLAKSNGWMDVQAEAKSIVIELESLITNDLLDDALYQII